MIDYSTLTLSQSISLGTVELATDEHPDQDRWLWFGDLYADPEWGLRSVFPDFSPTVAGSIHTACNAMSTGTFSPAQRSELAEQWRAVAALAREERDSAPTEALEIAWSAVLDTCTDAADYLAGRAFGGLEAILGVSCAVALQRSEADAASFINRAHCAWHAQLHDAVHDAVA